MITSAYSKFRHLLRLELKRVVVVGSEIEESVLNIAGDRKKATAHDEVNMPTYLCRPLHHGTLLFSPPYQIPSSAPLVISSSSIFSLFTCITSPHILRLGSATIWIKHNYSLFGIIIK
jgi:hypothetical protein